MKVQRVQNNQTSFQALKGFECSKSLKPIIGDAGEAIEKKLVCAFNENVLFQELCNKYDVYVNIKPKYNEWIKSGLEVEIYASKLNKPNIGRKENVMNYHTFKLYEANDYERIYDYSELTKNDCKIRLMDLICDFDSCAEDIIHRFIKHYNFKSEIKHFFEESSRM